MTVEKCSNVIVNFMFFDLFPAIRVLINAGWRAAWPPRHCHRTCQIHTNQHMNLKCLGHFKFIGQINWTEILPTSFRTKWFGLCIIIINLIIIIIVYNSLLFFPFFSLSEDMALSTWQSTHHYMSSISLVCVLFTHPGSLAELTSGSLITY